MNKIGFRIYRFQNGPFIGLTVNEGDWTKKVVDIRDILKLYSSKDESKFAMFMSFSENGAYITIARSISGRGGDNTAAWIYIPNNIEVTGDEMISIIKVVKEELSASKSNDERLTQIFNKEYRTLEAADYLPSSVEKVFAKRVVPFYPLKEIIGPKRYQPIYSNYNAILIDDNDGMEIVDKNITDLTQQKMVETLVFCPPVKQDIPHGVTVHFNAKGHPLFNKPVRVNKSQRIMLIFKRTGFEDINYMDSVEENDQICGIPVYDWKITVSKNQFKVRAAHNRDTDLSKISRIYINGTELTLNQAIQLSETAAKNVTIRVSAAGYETCERKINLLSIQIPILFQLNRAERVHSWEIKLSNGATAEMTLKSKYLPSKSSSPLQGYSIDEVNDHLLYSNFNVLKQRAIGFIMAIIAGLIVFLCVELYGWYDCHTFTWQLGWPPLKIETVQADQMPSSQDYITNLPVKTSHNQYSTKKAIKYLDNNDKWTRDSLIKYPVLDGLYEELNRYEFEKLKKRSGVLANSSKYKELISVIEMNEAKPFSGTFNSEGDYTITIKKYIEKLNKPISETPSDSRQSGVEQITIIKTNPKKNKTTPSGSTDKNKQQRGRV